MNMETLEILVNIGIFFVLWTIIHSIFRLIAFAVDDTKERGREKEAKIIYKRREREFDYHNNQEGWKKWKYMNTEICDLVEGGSYY